MQEIPREHAEQALTIIKNNVDSLYVDVFSYVSTIDPANAFAGNKGYASSVLLTPERETAELWEKFVSLLSDTLRTLGIKPLERGYDIESVKLRVHAIKKRLLKSDSNYLMLAPLVMDNLTAMAKIFLPID